jgi:hypothetical protein
MKLEDYAEGEKPLLLPFIGGDKLLARQIQQRLIKTGLLDPPDDGSFGPVSHWALGELLKRLDISSKKSLDAEMALSILDDRVLSLFQLNTPESWSGRIVRAMQENQYWICRHPACFNIIYFEGTDAGGIPNNNRPNEFNDLRLVLRVNKAGNPEVIEEWEATSEPGRYYTLVEKLDPQGAARIAFGQYKAWSVGIHNSKSPSAHEALVQTAEIVVHRDFNQDFKRDGDSKFTGLFGINQHWGFDMNKKDVGKASAGCLVGRTKVGHSAFMKICRSDPRYIVNGSYRFMTAIMLGSG